MIHQVKHQKLMDDGVDHQFNTIIWPIKHHRISPQPEDIQFTIKSSRLRSWKTTAVIFKAPESISNNGVNTSSEIGSDWFRW